MTGRQRRRLARLARRRESAPGPESGRVALSPSSPLSPSPDGGQPEARPSHVEGGSAGKGGEGGGVASSPSSPVARDGEGAGPSRPSPSPARPRLLTAAELQAWQRRAAAEREARLAALDHALDEARARIFSAFFEHVKDADVSKLDRALAIVEGAPEDVQEALLQYLDAITAVWRGAWAPSAPRTEAATA